MSSSRVVEELEKRFLPTLHRMAQHISREFPSKKEN